MLYADFDEEDRAAFADAFKAWQDKNPIDLLKPPDGAMFTLYGPVLRDALFGAMVFGHDMGVQCAADPLDDNIDRMAGLLDRMEHLLQARAVVDKEHPTRERLLEAVRWALGETDSFEAPEFFVGTSRPPFWWRPELRRRAGL